jgi:L-ascorbate metabolism protein UlaG (beta-lactamase superfamily)
MDRSGETADPSPARVTYVGHATLVIESQGTSVVTDPVLGDRIAGLFTKRAQPCDFRPEDLRGSVSVLISHAHHDHLDYPSLRRFGRAVPVVVPWGVRLPMRLRGFRQVHVLRPWEETTLGGWRVTAVPARHFGGRLPLVFTSGYQGYVLSGPVCIYFAGDTGYDEPMFREIRRRFSIDLAVLPIAGALLPRYRRNHMNAPEALLAYRALGARQMLPMHYETFPVSLDPAHEARRTLMEGLKELGSDHNVSLLSPGKSLDLVSSASREAGGSDPAVGSTSSVPGPLGPGELP